MSSRLVAYHSGWRALVRGRCRGPAWRLVAALLLIGGLAGCAGSVAPPTVVVAFPSGERAGLHVGSVTTEAAPGVAVTSFDTDRITQLVLADIQAGMPGMIDASAAQARTVRIVITRFDEGSAAARFMLAGLGQIRLEGDVSVVEATTGRVIAAFKVAKQFSFGGLYGGLTSMKDVEEGFAKSVAALLKPE